MQSMCGTPLRHIFSAETAPPQTPHKLGGTVTCPKSGVGGVLYVVISSIMGSMQGYGSCLKGFRLAVGAEEKPGAVDGR